MVKFVYSLKMKKNTKELHLFRATPIEEGCISEGSSICNEMKKGESEKIFFFM